MTQELEGLQQGGVGIGELQFESPRVTVRRSDSFGKLTEALAKAQITYEPIKKAVENSFYTTDKKKAMYADLAAIIAATQKSLAENGLVIIQLPLVESKTKEAGTRSLLSHSSGEWIECDVLLPATAKAKDYKPDGSYTWGAKFDAQTVGIAITYTRRYAYQSMVGVAAEEDDDANGIGEAAGGSKEAQQEVAKRKLANAPIPSLFFTWNDESQTATITGADSLQEAHRPLLRKFWSPTAGAIVVNAEQLDGLKYEFEKLSVPFKSLAPAKGRK